MIQVIPFHANTEPDFLPLLVRGLSDLSALRFNAADIDSQINMDLEINAWKDKLEQPVTFIKWDDEELWFSGELKFSEGKFTTVFVLYDPRQDQLVYSDIFISQERLFLQEWENHLYQLLQVLKGSDEDLVNRPMYTQSLDAFLEFRKGLEKISQAKNQLQREEGLENLLNSVAYDPEFIEAADILLLFLFQNGVSKNFEESLKVLERLREVAGDHPRIPLVMAELYYQWGNYEKAEKFFGEVVSQFPDFLEGWLRVALYYHSLGQFAKALTALGNILERDPENSTALDLMGAVYAGMDEHSKAEEAWLKTLEIDPGRVNVLNNLGLLAEERGNIIKAERFYQQAVTLNENWWGSYYNYGSFCSRQGRLEEAVVFLEKSTQLNPAHYQSFLFLSKVQIKLGQFGEAQESVLDLLRIAPDNVIRRQGLQLLDKLDRQEIQTELKLRKIEKVWGVGRRWLALVGLLKLSLKAKNLWFFWYLWGRIIEDLGFKSLAVIFWGLGQRYKPGYPLLKKLGLHYWSKKNDKKALPLLRKAFKMHKSDQEILNAYLQTLINLGEVEEYHSNMRKIVTTGHDVKSFSS